ncbi:hypothetical protein [Streptomyces yaizuensis]|uniref:Uncharacterized protein n=1 Tax=Streptomyces yaizuensis TaxID=2989713 RepID=A0ABQ5NY85_9ACTN|nr:hypothetical protein [Streptomyces sp. YSPA8]GLF95150.1 hypothetical protein SYYSPA8_12655 [Streptomyces sp. YSPA8]
MTPVAVLAVPKVSDHQLASFHHSSLPALLPGVPPSGLTRSLLGVLAGLRPFFLFSSASWAAFWAAAAISARRLSVAIRRASPAAAAAVPTSRPPIAAPGVSAS